MPAPPNLLESTEDIPRGRSVLITGCSQGSIGEQLALEFLLRGFIVCATGLPSESLPELEKKGVKVYGVDVTKDDSVAALKEAVMHDLNGHLDILINCAGIRAPKNFRNQCFGVVRMVQALAPALMATSGRVVNIGSLAAYAPYVFGASYNASKAALLALGNTLRIELLPWKVEVTTILAGPIESGLMVRATRTLPNDSFYQPIVNYFNARTHHTKHGVQPMSRVVFAKEIVNQVLQTRAPWTYWIGPYNWSVWLVQLFDAQFLWHRFFTKRFGLDVLASFVNKGKKKKST